jgi:integrase
LSFGVDAAEVKAFADVDLVKDFLGRYESSPQTTSLYGRILCMFFKWLRVVQKVELSPGDFLNEHLRRRSSLSIEDRRWGLKLALRFSRDNPELKGSAAGYRYLLFTVLKEFFGYHEAELTSVKGVFGKKEKTKYKPKQMSAEVAKKVLGCLGQREKTICLMMLQSGQSIKEILIGLDSKLAYLTEQGRAGSNRIRLEYDERKGNGFKYFTFISQDGIQELKKWLVLRQKLLDQCGLKSDRLFITKTGRPYTVKAFAVVFYQRVQAAKICQGPYTMRSHMFRKLFRSEAGVPDRGIDPSCVEFWMGHSEEIKGKGGIYDRSPELYADMIEKEYAKLEPYINIYSQRRVDTQTERISDEDMDTLKLLIQKVKEGKIKVLD